MKEAFLLCICWHEIFTPNFTSTKFFHVLLSSIVHLRIIRFVEKKTLLGVLAFYFQLPRLRVYSPATHTHFPFYPLPPSQFDSHLNLSGLLILFLL
jgi:hypothetical protein